MHPLATILCYRYQAWACSYDSEDVWAFVQRHKGYISIGAAGTVDYYIPRDYCVFFEIAYPELCRQPELDYI